MNNTALPEEKSIQVGGPQWSFSCVTVQPWLRLHSVPSI